MKIYLTVKCSYSLIPPSGIYMKKMISETGKTAHLLDYCRNLVRDLSVSILALHCPQPLIPQHNLFSTQQWPTLLLKFLHCPTKVLYDLLATCGISFLFPHSFLSSQGASLLFLSQVGHTPVLWALFLEFPLPQSSSPDPSGPTPASLQPLLGCHLPNKPCPDLLNSKFQFIHLPLNTRGLVMPLTLFFLFFILYQLLTMFMTCLPTQNARST